MPVCTCVSVCVCQCPAALIGRVVPGPGNDGAPQRGTDAEPFGRKHEFTMSVAAVFGDAEDMAVGGRVTMRYYSMKLCVTKPAPRTYTHKKMLTRV